VTPAGKDTVTVTAWSEGFAPMLVTTAPNDAFAPSVKVTLAPDGDESMLRLMTLLPPPPPPPPWPPPPPHPFDTSATPKRTNNDPLRLRNRLIDAPLR